MSKTPKKARVWVVCTSHGTMALFSMSPLRRGAIAKYLGYGTFLGVPPPNAAMDRQWRQCKADGLTVQRVTVTPKES